jgi:hypothetical protein
LILALALSAFAEDPAFTTHGDLRWIGSGLTDFPVDAEGTMIGQSLWLDQRLRAGLDAKISPLVTAQFELDALTGQLAGDTWDIPGEIDARRRWEHGALTWHGLNLRRAVIQGYAGNLQLRAGWDTSHWGLGVIANDGAHDPLFGRTDLGDRNLRIRMTHVPSSDGASTGTLLTTVALDVVAVDDILESSHWNLKGAAAPDGQWASQAIVSALWLGRNQRKAGAYAVFRQQWEQGGERNTSAFVLDGYGDLPFTVADWKLRAATELVGIAAVTDRATTYNSRDGIYLLSWGGVAEFEATQPDGVAKYILRAAYGSGDGNPDDGVARDFGIDRNVGAGLVLFDQVQGSVDAATHALLSDPERSGKPPDGIDTLVAEGGVRHATFLQPAVDVAATDWLGLRAGAVVAWSTSPVSQPFYTYRAGGTPHNHHDVATGGGHFIGSELDWAARLGPTDPERLRPSFEIQGGHGFLGKAMQGAGPNVIHHVQATARLQW